MYGGTTCVNGRYTGGGKHYHALWTGIPDPMQKGCFSRTCPAGQKNVGVRMVNILKRQIKLLIWNSRHTESVFDATECKSNTFKQTINPSYTLRNAAEGM
jgi:hypothetical protein